MGESSKFPKFWTLEIQNLKLAVCLQNIKNSKLNGQIALDKLKLYQKSYYYLQISAFWGWLSMESQPQNPEFRNNPENFHPCYMDQHTTYYICVKSLHNYLVGLQAQFILVWASIYFNTLWMREVKALAAVWMHNHVYKYQNLVCWRIYTGMSI